VRLPEITPGNLKSILAGTDTNVSVRQEFTAPPKPEAPKLAPQETPAQPPAAQPPTTQPAPPATPPVAEATPAKLRFEPATLTLKTGETTTLAVVVDDVKDLFSIPMLLQYNPAVISVEEVRHGGFLSGGTQEIAIVQRVDKERGQAIISATRQPNTPGVSGTGTLVGIVIKALAPGSSSISVVQVRARDSQQKPITLVSSEAAIRVQ
jgi:general secretion pathway protein D